jgi:hypothetical protein
MCRCEIEGLSEWELGNPRPQLLAALCASRRVPFPSPSWRQFIRSRTRVSYQFSSPLSCIHRATQELRSSANFAAPTCEKGPGFHNAVPQLKRLREKFRRKMVKYILFPRTYFSFEGPSIQTHYSSPRALSSSSSMNYPHLVYSSLWHSRTLLHYIQALINTELHVSTVNGYHQVYSNCTQIIAHLHCKKCLLFLHFAVIVDNETVDNVKYIHQWYVKHFTSRPVVNS